MKQKVISKPASASQTIQTERERARQHTEKMEETQELKIQGGVNEAQQANANNSSFQESANPPLLKHIYIENQ